MFLFVNIQRTNILGGHTKALLVATRVVDATSCGRDFSDNLYDINEFEGQGPSHKLREWLAIAIYGSV